MSQQYVYREIELDGTSHLRWCDAKSISAAQAWVTRRLTPWQRSNYQAVLYVAVGQPIDRMVRPVSYRVPSGNCAIWFQVGESHNAPISIDLI